MARLDIYPIPSCDECGIQSAGACPTCHHPLCVDHFSFEAHEPCSSRLAGHEAVHVCYICGTPSQPRQWSTEIFAHYVDLHRCEGCHRAICDEPHTAALDEKILVRRAGVRGHRYHMMKRYCTICVHLQRFGGLIGATWWLVGVIAALALVIIAAQVALSIV